MALQIYKIATVELTADTANIVFSSIPQGYTDLKLVWSTRTPNATPSADTIIIWINGAATSGSQRSLYGTGSTVTSASGTPIYIESGTVGSAATANTFSNGELLIPNYASTTAYKSVSIDSVTENNATLARAGIAAGLYSSNTAITSITLVPNFANFTQYTTATLYGIL